MIMLTGTGRHYMKSWLYAIPLYSSIASVSILGYTWQEMIKVTCKALTVWDVGRIPPPPPTWHTRGTLILVAWAQHCAEEESLCQTEPLSSQQTLCLPLSSLSVLWFPHSSSGVSACHPSRGAANHAHLLLQALQLGGPHECMSARNCG